nr:aminoacyl-histidine dipeptidase [uncultured Cellulosilyticum sp.]
MPNKTLEDLRQQGIFKYFEAISSIPRGSGNEKAISDYMVQFANNLGLEVRQDEAYNIYIKKPATEGFENAPTVILQGHMDMVCEKNKDTEHDFLRDGLDLYVDGDWLAARGTTLGADNGIAIAYQMAILADNTLKHPALECLMTTDEERGMTGVAALHPEYLQGRILLNLDTDVEGEFLVSCAGGAKVYMTFPKTKEAAEASDETYEVIINGLVGGHSGAEIHHERANAHILMGRYLDALRDKCDFKLCEITGGTKDNVITRECEVKINVSPSEATFVNEVALEMNGCFKDEYSVQDKEIKITVQKAQKEAQNFTTDLRDKVIDFILTIPNGIMGYDKHMTGLVQTSLNLGIVQTEENVIRFGSAVRSSVATRKWEVIHKLEALSRHFGAHCEVTGDYPAWQYDAESKVRDLAVALYEEMHGQKPTVTAIHAGLECGFISEKLPGLDMISFGPNVKDIHSPQERASISSMESVYAYLIKLLEKLGAY